MKPKRKKRGIVVAFKMCGCGCNELMPANPKSFTTDTLGIRPLKPGESRRVRIIVEEE